MQHAQIADPFENIPIAPGLPCPDFSWLHCGARQGISEWHQFSRCDAGAPQTNKTYYVLMFVPILSTSLFFCAFQTIARSPKTWGMMSSTVPRPFLGRRRKLFASGQNSDQRSGTFWHQVHPQSSLTIGHLSILSLFANPFCEENWLRNEQWTPLSCSKASLTKEPKSSHFVPCATEDHPNWFAHFPRCVALFA